MRRALLKAFNYVSGHLKFSIYKVRELASLSKYWLGSFLGNSLPWRCFVSDQGAGARFSKAYEFFRARKTVAKFRTLRLQSCFMHTF